MESYVNLSPPPSVALIRPAEAHLEPRTGPAWTPSEKMPVNDPTPRIILRLVVLSGGKIGVKKGGCR